MSAYTFVGNRSPRIEATDKVTGKARYSADILLPDMLHGKVLRSPYAHARIKRLDIHRVTALEGVMAVVTAADVPALQNAEERLAPMMPCMAREKVVFCGQPVAAVAATDPYIAEEALQLIDIDYEELPSVTDVMAAMEPDAPLVYTNLQTDGLPEGRPSNIFFHAIIPRGDVESGFRQADIILENTYCTQTVHQGYLEPRACVVEPSPNGTITVWTDNQGVFKVRELIAAFLEIPLNRIKVMPVEIGGAFGGKEHQQLSPLCALLAMKTGHPVRMTMTRGEVFTATRPAPATAITIKMGVTNEGLITSASARLVFDYGTSTGMSGLMPYHQGMHCLSLYRIPHLCIEYIDVVTNKPPSGPYRAPGAAQATFAVESHLDLLAKKLKMDPLEQRMKNLVSKGDTLVDSSTYPDIGFRQTLEKMVEYLKLRPGPTGECKGRGMSCGLWAPRYLGSAAHINVNADGSVVLVVGSTDVSGTRTAFAQMVAEAFGIPLDFVSVVTGDTETAPHACISAGSMVTRSMGKAIYRACDSVKEKLCKRAAGRMKLSFDEVEYCHGRVRAKNDYQNFLLLADLVKASSFPDDGPICGSGASDQLGPPSHVFAVHVADVEVDHETGKVQVLSYIAAQDTGLTINPTLVEGQLQGGVVQGIGWALSEDYVWNNGVMQNPNFTDYRMPTAADVPYIDTLLVEVGAEHTPYGIRGVGEPPMVPTLAAIANAIHDAVGIRLYTLPMSPEVVLSKMKIRTANDFSEYNKIDVPKV